MTSTRLACAGRGQRSAAPSAARASPRPPCRCRSGTRPPPPVRARSAGRASRRRPRAARAPHASAAARTAARCCGRSPGRSRRARMRSIAEALAGHRRRARAPRAGSGRRPRLRPRRAGRGSTGRYPAFSPSGWKQARQRASYSLGAPRPPRGPRACHQPLRAVRGRAAAHADRERLVDVLGDRHQLRHRLEGPAAVVLVEPGHDHAQPAVGERVRHLDQARVEELALVDPDHLGVAAPRAAGSRAAFSTTCDGSFISEWLTISRLGEARVEPRLEQLHLLARDLGPAHAPDQLLALAAEHAAGDHLDAAGAGPPRDTDMEQGLYLLTRST